MTRNLKQALHFSLLIFLLAPVLAQDKIEIERVEPPFWWTDMGYNEVQLLVYGKDISQAKVSAPEGIEIQNIHSTGNPNYLFIDIEIVSETKAGNYRFQFSHGTKQPLEISYVLRERNPISKGKQGFNSADAIYLLMPDRFSNGNPANDRVEGMLQAADRSNPDGRHGGDIAGIINHLDYMADMGFTALWINPLVENNNFKESYHGYAITDFYRIDARMGTNADYLDLVDKAHNRGLKIIMDMVFNHSSTNHWFINDLPMDDWIHQWEDTTKSNFRGETTNDPYAPDSDLKLTVEGWFDHHMADLNQVGKNQFTHFSGFKAQMLACFINLIFTEQQLDNLFSMIQRITPAF